MKIQIASDLHLEFLSKAGQDGLIDNFDGKADILVLAGDIVSLKNIYTVRDTFAAFCDKYKHVVFVLGNHEYYGTSVSAAHTVLGAACNEFYNLHVLRNNSEIIEEQKFFGGSLWFNDNPRNKPIKKNLNDFNLIKDFEPWVYNEAREFVEQASLHIDDKTIVVSHHLPSYLSVAPKFAGSDFNNFFVNDVEHLIHSYNPKLWIHGHTHIGIDYKVRDTRVVCNPLGYPGERFFTTLVVDV